MKLDPGFLRSRVGRRILALFVLCALLPMTALAVLSLRQVTSQLHTQARERLRQASKAQGMMVLGRLELMDAELGMIASGAAAGPGGDEGFPSARPALLQERFVGLQVMRETLPPRSLLGRLVRVPALTAEEEEHLREGKALVSVLRAPGTENQVLMRRAVDPEDLQRGILVGEMNQDFLWGVEALPGLHLCILEEAEEIFCTAPVPDSFLAGVREQAGRGVSGTFGWEAEEKEYLASYWSLFLKERFLAASWAVVLSEPRADVLLPMGEFRYTFILVVAVSLWVVLLLSLVQIRRSLVPLEKLQEGTKRIAQRAFETRVAVHSGDEFQELAESFNGMASRLGRQFHALATIREIDRAVLSALDTEKIVDTVLTRLPDVLPCDSVSVTVLESDAANTARTYVGDGARGENWWKVQLRPEEVQKLRDNPESMSIGVDEDFLSYLVPLAERGIKSFLLLPIFLNQGLAGIINLGYRDSPAHSQDDLVQARQLADQVAVALANARLLTELDEMNWRTLTALARAIDAKSPWTAGHSERVTKLALKIGRQMGLSEQELVVMHRGGLLHDIGKIGTPPGILDKPGRLEAGELKIMQEHVRGGGRILEPIAGFREIMPIVLQHHEWYNGKGYPEGLAGEAIHLHARIFAVADCYDALVSERPYRPGLPREKVIGILRDESGTHFDPKVVEAFLEVTKQEEEGPRVRQATGMRDVAS